MESINQIIKNSELADGVRTSMSLPAEVLLKLDKASKKTNLAVGYLALLCLLKSIKSKKISLSNEATITYNHKRCSDKINIYLSLNEQIYLRTIRASMAISISFLMVQSVEAYLIGIVRTLRHKLVRNYTKLKRWLLVFLRNGRIHNRKIELRSPCRELIFIELIKYRNWGGD